MTKPKPKLTPDVAKRLKILRAALKIETQAAFAARYNLTSAQWSNIERGFPLTHTLAIKIVLKTPGLSLDWIYLGRSEGLSVRLSQQIEEVSKDLDAEAP